MGGFIAHDLHRRRREALNPFFSARRITQSLESELRNQTSQVEKVFASCKDNGQVLNLSDLYFAFANE